MLFRLEGDIYEDRYEDELSSSEVLKGGAKKGDAAPTFTNTSRQESHAGSEAESNKSNQAPKMRLLDRSQLMDLMLFPQNCKKMVIVPSNKEGTGFLNHCYDKKYLIGFITEKEFNAIILICSRIAARAYSNKQIIDRQKTSDKMLLFIGLSTFIAFLGIVLLTLSAVYNSKFIDYFASILLAPAILMVLGINIYTWKKGQPEPLTFNKMVKDDLDEFFQKINDYYAEKTK